MSKFYSVYAKSMGKDVNRDQVILLEDFEDRAEAIRWARGYCGSENMGGWDLVFVNTWCDETIWSCYKEPTEYCDNACDTF